MRFEVPHPIPYQGSKRRLADAILSQFSEGQFQRLIEPFAGSAAVTLAAASQRRFERYLIGDSLQSLAALWQAILVEPAHIASQYELLWLRERASPIKAYYDIRAEFNVDGEPAKLLYLLARCVKNAVRFNPSGAFNQSPDKRRTGTHPATMRDELYGAHRLLSGQCECRWSDFTDLLSDATEDDLVYLDPPYQGTSDGRDQRYIKGLSREAVVNALEDLNSRGVNFILSYDGSLGAKSYGEPLPASLAHQLRLNVGRSSQATLNGTDDVTVESLYLSHGLVGGVKRTTATLADFSPQQLLFA